MEGLQKEIDHVVDITEASVTTRSEEDTNDDVCSNKGSKRTLARLKSGVISLDGGSKGECSINHNNLGDLKSELLIKNKNSTREKDFSLLEKQQIFKEKPPTTPSKNSSKPPRPPRGPSLCGSDLVLLREMSELAMKKRARVEHMKSLKKKRALKSSASSSSSSASNSSVPALVFTLLFCLVIIFQGKCSRSNTTTNLVGSPEPAVASVESGLISVEFYDTQSPSDNNGPSSMSPDYAVRFAENGPASGSRSPG